MRYAYGEYINNNNNNLNKGAYFMAHLFLAACNPRVLEVSLGGNLGQARGRL